MNTEQPVVTTEPLHFGKEIGGAIPPRNIIHGWLLHPLEMSDNV